MSLSKSSAPHASLMKPITSTSQMATSSADPSIIAVMGPTGTGKSTFVNLISGSQFPVSHGLKSCTFEVLATKPFLLNGRPVILLDTPGFDDTNEKDTDILAEIGTTLATIRKKGKVLSGILYFHNIEDRKMKGISVRNHRVFRQLCGDDPMKSVIIVTNMWTETNSEIGEMREEELKNEEQFFKYSVTAGARMMRHFNTPNTATDIIQTILSTERAREALKIQKEIVEERRRLEETSAAGVLKDDFEALIQKLRRDVEDATALLEEARAEEEKRLLERDIRRMENRIDELRRRKTSTSWSVRRVIRRIKKMFK